MDSSARGKGAGCTSKLVYFWTLSWLGPDVTAERGDQVAHVGGGSPPARAWVHTRRVAAGADADRRPALQPSPLVDRRLRGVWACQHEARCVLSGGRGQEGGAVLVIQLRGGSPVLHELELELELIQSHMTQKPMLLGEVGARALRNPEGKGKGRKVVHTSEHVAGWWGARACMCCRASGAP